MDKPALISLTFDDGLRCQFDRALPILDQYGFSATFFLVADADPIHRDGFPHPNWRRTDWSEKDIQFFNSMIQRGHEIGAHSVHHRYPFLDDDPRGEAEGSKKWIKDRLEVDEVPSYCYPFCHVTEPIRNAVTGAGYRQARGGANASYYTSQGPADWFNVDCRHIGLHGEERVEGWIRSCNWHVLMFHGIGTLDDGWWPISVADFSRQMAELTKRRDAGAVEVVTFRDAADRLRSPT